MLVFSVPARTKTGRSRAGLLNVPADPPATAWLTTRRFWAGQSMWLSTTRPDGLVCGGPSGGAPGYWRGLPLEEYVRRILFWGTPPANSPT